MDGIRVFDLHCDTIDALAMTDTEPYSSWTPTPTGDLATNNLALDAERMRAVGGWAQCLAIWVPDDLSTFSGQGPLEYYRRARDWFLGQVAAHGDVLAQVRDAREVDGVLASGRMAGILTVEGGSPIGHDLGVIDEMAADGVRMLTLTWNGPNTIGSGHDTHEGLSAFGRQAVRHLEDARIVVDVSHLNDEGFWDVARMARRPFAASHSNARSVCGHLRNLTDEQFRAIVDAGGVVGLNYCTGFVRDGAWGTDVSFDDMAAHVERFLDLGGEGVIALGSDFDGCTTPSWLATCADLPAFRTRLASRFGEDLAERMLFTNARDFFVRNETA